MKEKYFDHEKLKVYQKAIEFIDWTTRNFVRREVGSAIYDQFDRASSSIALNIAERNGKYTSKDRCKYFDISRGSALECVSCLDIMISKGIINKNTQIEGKKILAEIVAMLVGLIKANSDRVCEQHPEYNENS